MIPRSTQGTARLSIRELRDIGKGYVFKADPEVISEHRQVPKDITHFALEFLEWCDAAIPEDFLDLVSDFTGFTGKT
jgi:hypothetical protein